MQVASINNASTSNRTYLTALHALYYCLFVYVYLNYISVIYLSEGFENSFSNTKFYVSLFTIFVFSISIPTHRKVVAFQLHFTLAIAIIPMLVIYCGMDLPNWFYCTAAVAYITTALSSQIAVSAPSATGIDPTTNMYIIIFLMIIFMLSFYFMGSFSNLNFDFNRVYELRRDVSDSLPAIYGYLIPIISKSLIPIAIVIAASLRKYSYVAILTGLSIVIFGLTTHKGIIFYPFVTIFIYVVFKKYKADSAFLLAISAVPAVAIVDFSLYLAGTGNAWVGSLLVRRALLLPALHNYYYMEFFSQNPWYWWSHSKLSLGLVQMPYETTAPFMIGIEYYNNEATSANTGWIGSGYANAGTFGVLLYAALTGLLFSTIEALSKKFGPSLVMGVFIIPVIDIFTSADLTTLLLTHGLLASILILMATAPILPAANKRNV